MANTFTLIASTTVGSGGASSIDFTSIPATYTDLVIKGSWRSTQTGQKFTGIGYQFNGDTASNYRGLLLYEVNSTPASYADTALGGQIQFVSYAASADNTSNTFSSIDFYLPNYAGSNQKSVSGDATTENNATDVGIQSLGAGLWTGTSAITSIKINILSGTFVQYSTAYLYGIKNS